MNSRERVLTALDHREPDRVPLHNFFTPEVLKRIEEKTGKKGCKAEIAAGNDVLVYTVGVATSFYQKDLDEYVDEWGITWKRVPHDHGIYTEMVGHPLSDIKNYESYKLPDPCKEKNYKNLYPLIENYKKSTVIAALIGCTLFEGAWYLRGLENWFIDQIENRDFANDILDKLTDYYIKAGKRLIEIGVDIIFTGDDFGMQDRMLISREQFLELYKPRYARIYSELKKTNNNILFAHHCDGYVEPIIHDFVEIGLDILNPVQPQCMDPVQIKKKYGKELSFWGTIDNQHVIPFGTDEELYDELTRIIKNVAPGGGLVLGGAHCIQPDHISEKNLFKMVEFVKQHGTYPIKL